MVRHCHRLWRAGSGRWATLLYLAQLGRLCCHCGRSAVPSYPDTQRTFNWIRAGDRVRVHYEGKLADGTVFTSSYNPPAPLVLKVRLQTRAGCECAAACLFTTHYLFSSS